MPKPTSAASKTMNVTVITLDGHLGRAAERAFAGLQKSIPSLRCKMHVAGEWGDADVLQKCIADIEKSDILIVCMMFMEEHINAVMPALKARRDACDAMLCFMCEGEVMRLTRIGKFSMDGQQSGPLALLKKLRGSKSDKTPSSGAKQIAMLKKLPRILRFIPGTAQDLRVYFLAMQYWLAGSEDNIRNLIALMVTRYSAAYKSRSIAELVVADPVEYPEVGLYHPRLPDRVTESRKALQAISETKRPVVGLLMMRSYILAGNTAHYDEVIAALESRGLNVCPVFASGLDARPAVEQFFVAAGKATIDGFISLTGFSLVGGPAYNDANAAAEMLGKLDVPCIAAHASEFQSLPSWHNSDAGLLPIETTMMVAIPELDGSIAPTLFAGRDNGASDARDLVSVPERVSALADRVARMVRLRATPRADRKVAITLFNFPPNSGATGTAAYLSVFRSLFNTLRGLKREGYSVDVPESVDELRDMILKGNAEQFGADANVHARVSVDDHVRRETWLESIEKQWGAAPGKAQADGRSIHILGRQFGNVLVGVQPAFGYEGDPMRLLFDKDLAPTHAFSAFYRYLREDFDANAVLHFGTHGALEFMPGKQAGMSGDCWPERLIGDLPNFYLYAANNPSEATIAKRRSGATIISYLTPTVTHAGLYRGLSDLQETVNRFRSLDPNERDERHALLAMIHVQAVELELRDANASFATDVDAQITTLNASLAELRDALIPQGMHVVGEATPLPERRDLLRAIAKNIETEADDQAIETLVAAAIAGEQNESASNEQLIKVNKTLSSDHEIDAIIHALDGGYIAPVTGGDLMRSADILPTGRNIHGFDPTRLPSTFACRSGAMQAEQLLDRHVADAGSMPESIALVLWGSDNLKTEGGPIGQALHLLGAKPRFDTYGRLAGATLLSLEELGRPRIDVLMTLSGIFRDLLPLQTRMLAEAAWLAATADEPLAQNFVRKHVLEYQKDFDCDLETAALRVYSNSVGAYGSSINNVIESGRWNDDSEIAAQYSQRKCFAYGRDGNATKHEALFERSLKDVSITFQNLESAELGITSIDHYFDTLGGISKAVERAKGEAVEVYIGDQTGDTAKIRTLGEQVALEARSRMLNPRWYEGLIEHGYEGVKQIESHVTNTMGWSATTGRVAPWIYQEISQTFVLDKDMRERLAALNPMACARVAGRLLEASDRNFWKPDAETLAALEQAGEELDDRLEGIGEVAA